MVNRLLMKGSIDSALGLMFGVGGAGLIMGIYDGNVIAGVFGCIALGMAIGTQIYRTRWNEKSKEE